MTSKIQASGTGDATAAAVKPVACDSNCSSKGGAQPCSCATAMGAAGSGCCCSGGGRRSSLRLWLFPLMALAVAGVLLLKEKNKPTTPPVKPAATAVGVPSTGELRAAPVKAAALPKLVDLGAIGCKPCKIMDGVLEELRTAYPGKLEVEFINVKTEAAKTAAYKISIIPTQVWLDAAGKELFRHEGVMAAAEIVTKFTELGIDLGAPVVGAAKTTPAAGAVPVANGATCP